MLHFARHLATASIIIFYAYRSRRLRIECGEMALHSTIIAHRPKYFYLLRLRMPMTIFNVRAIRLQQIMLGAA